MGLIEKNGSITAEEYAELNPMARSAANIDIREMIEKGLIEQIGKTRGSKYVMRKR